MSISVKIESSKLINFNNNLQRNQYPFALSLAINKVSDQAVKNVRKRMSGIYNIRRKWTLNRVNYIKSNKKQAAGDILNYWKIQSEIYLDWEGLVRLEEGGELTPTKSKRLAVPQRDNLKVGIKKSIPKNKKISNINNGFIRTKGSIKSFFKRDGKSLKYMYSLPKKSKYKPTLQFRQTVETTVNRHLQSWLADSINHAIKTAK